MMTTFLLSTAIAGVSSGVIGYVGFDKILYQTMRSASPGKQIAYIIALLWIFTFGTTIPLIELFFDVDNWTIVIAAVFGVMFLFSLPGLMVGFAAYILLSTNQFDNIINFINETATIIVGLVAGIVVAMVVSSPELSGLEAAIYQYHYDMIFVFKMLVGGFIGASTAGITKFVLSLIW